jgi:glycosyltransferase involved in cell wall biosynthesis
MRPLRLGLLAASPVHYHVPTYRLLAQDPAIDFTAIFCSRAGVEAADLGFGERIAWGGDLLSGYRSKFLRRADRNDLFGGFLGLRDPDVVPFLARERFDVVWLHGYNHLTHQLAIATQRARRGGLIVREEQTLIHPRGLAKTVLKEAALRAMFRHTLGVYIGTESKRWFEHYGVPDDRLYFAPYSVDNHLLQDAAARMKPRREELRRSFGIRDEAGPVLLTSGRLVANKQPGRVLEAFAQVRASRPCALLMVGDGELARDLVQVARRESIPDVTFTGFLDQTEIWRAYASADVFTLFSSLHETWGIVVNEAMNFSLPVVVSDKVGCGTDLVSDGRNGFIVPVSDTSQLEERIHALLDDEGMRSRFGEESRAIVSQWSPERTAEGIASAAAAARPVTDAGG